MFITARIASIFVSSTAVHIYDFLYICISKYICFTYFRRKVILLSLLKNIPYFHNITFHRVKMVTLDLFVTPFIPDFCLRRIGSLLRLSLKHPPGYSKGLLIQLTPTSLTSESVAVCTIYVIPSKLIKETKSVNTVLVVQIVWLSFCPVMEV